MGTQFGQIRSNADIFDQNDLSNYIKNNSIADLYVGANADSIARKLNNLEARDDVSFANLSALISADVDQNLTAIATSDSILGRLSAVEDRDDVSFADLSALIQDDTTEYDNENADDNSIIKRISSLEAKVQSLETTVGQIEDDIDDMLEGNP